MGFFFKEKTAGISDLILKPVASYKLLQIFIYDRGTSSPKSYYFSSIKYFEKNKIEMVKCYPSSILRRNSVFRSWFFFFLLLYMSDKINWNGILRSILLIFWNSIVIFLQIYFSFKLISSYRIVHDFYVC